MTKRPSHHPIRTRTMPLVREPHCFAAGRPVAAKAAAQADTEPANVLVSAIQFVISGHGLSLSHRSIHTPPATRSKLSP